MNRPELEDEQRAWYATLYAQAGKDRNDLRLNSGVLFQVLANERSVVRALRHIAAPLSSFRVLDVGCGAGGNWYQLIRLGVKPENIVGVEIQSERIAGVKDVYPQATAICGDATAIDVPANSFDLICEFGLFATLTDEKLREDIAAEMLRVCKPGGYLLLNDWRLRKYWNPAYGALSRRDVRRLFGLGARTRLVATGKGSLLPILGRLLSKYAPPLYFLIAGLFPPLVAQVAYLLQKESNSEVIV